MICTKCKIDKNLSEFNRDNARKIGYKQACRVCNGHSPNKKDRPLVAKEKVKAWNKLYYELKIGRIIKPTTCEVCKKESKIEAHHNDYDNLLDVIWCCKSCHSNLDIERRNYERICVQPDTRI